MMQLFHRGAMIRPFIVRMKHGYEAVVIIEREGSEQRSSGPLGHFASSNAAHNFAINWAIAKLDERPVPRPPVTLSLVPGEHVQ
jgi:hypothetical protein